MKKNIIAGLLGLFCLAAVAATPPIKYNVFSTNTLARATFVPATGVFSITNAVRIGSNIVVAGEAEVGTNLIVYGQPIFGVANYITNDATTYRSAILGGATNSIGRQQPYCTIAGGLSNSIPSYGVPGSGWNFIGAGGGNIVNGSEYCSIIAGRNCYLSSGHSAVIAGGEDQTNAGSYNFVGCGQANYLSGQGSAILGGTRNSIDGGEASCIGSYNVIEAESGSHQFVIGSSNSISGVANSAAVIGYKTTNTTSYTIAIGVNDKALVIGAATISYAGRTLHTGIVTNYNPIGPVTNYCYYTNGLLFYVTNNYTGGLIP